MIRIGLLGAARIADRAIIQPAAKRSDVVIAAVAASNLEKAQAFVQQFGIEHAFGSYDELIARDDIDLIYNALPPSLHAKWSIRALLHGKHVLCEKPFAMDVAEAKDMVATAKISDRLLIEGYHYRFHPVFAEVERLVKSGELGTIHTVRSNFSVRIAETPGSLRHNAPLGGGALMDLGCYPLHWLRTLFGGTPEILWADAICPKPQLDSSFELRLQFPNGPLCYVGCAMSEHLSRHHDASLYLEGDKAQLEVLNLVAPHQGHKLCLTKRGEPHEYQINGDSTYDHQLAHVVACIKGETKPLTGGKDAIDQMQLIDDAYKAAGLLPRGLCR
ncbi:Gfo/Idh/MocA family protein [Rheinheimera soli]|uniref:Gfo/Idh/MocA family protein n=1 Tax=Rheinheimera soli TaxID=443616 RepID=UPI001E3724CA|nr:Gfo/Idh/MocA family oxidoreductase [Rheinheimera soli]